MTVRSSSHRREVLNQLLNFFWTILCFAPVLWFWMKEGVSLYFYMFIAISLIIGILPDKMLNMFTLSSDTRFYHKLGVKKIRKLVQNGDVVNMAASKQRHSLINGVAQARRYLKTIAMYERFHWSCFTFFLLTAIFCFAFGHLKLGFLIIAANLIYNASSILLQQYNKIRIRKFTG